MRELSKKSGDSKLRLYRQRLSGFAAHFGPPPAHPHQEEPPIAEEFGWGVLKSVPGKLQRPSQDKQAGAIGHESAKKNRCHEERERYHDERNPNRVAGAVYAVLVAARVLCDPLLAGAFAEHGSAL